MSFLKLAFFLAASLSWFGCRTPPLVETCLIGDDGCICSDPRKPEGEQDYTLSWDECRNYVARSADSELLLRQWGERNCNGR